ncbi:MAG: ABC transporter substrate-binding protein [Deltaproteobacteria bacterium]|jgi:iron complex transport system substrate-binding protein|nr:ABC transporter substrate-binding protein [Deltaproteobacteria bacterium]
MGTEPFFSSRKKPRPKAKTFFKVLALAFLAIFAALALTPFSQALLAQENQAPNESAKPNLRIISLYAADTEILLRLGARDQLVGISRQETYDGPETKDWPRPPEFSIHDDVEKFLAAAPDYILIRPMHLSASPALFQTLEKTGIKIWSRQCTEAKDLFDFWRELGEISGKQDQVNSMIEEFQAKIAALTYQDPQNGQGQAQNQDQNKAQGQNQRPGVFLEAIHKEVKTFTPDSIPVWLLTLAGGRNVADDSEPTRPGQIVANYGPERLLEKADQVDVFISQEGPMNKVDLKTVKERKIYAVLPAFKNNRVYRIPEELISRPSPSLVEGLELLKGMIHPQK